LTNALRKTLIAATEQVSLQAKALVSGHAADGTRLQVPHLAYLPLAFVGHEHADGHVLGMALAFPKGLKGEDEDAIWKSLAEASSEDGTIKLVLGGKGEMFLQMDDRGEKAPQALLSHTWCRASKTWASVTPLVLDRMQHSRRSDPDGWAAGQIGDMCERQGLPRPAQVLIRQPVSFHLGSPTAREFQALKRKDGSSHRMVHAHLTFKDAVAGPLVLGAGRYKGYGLCKPIGAFEEPSC
jgi:CRISPR-associated protein Csb2